MDEKIPLMFIRDEEKELDDLYIKISKRFRILMKALDAAIRRAGEAVKVRKESLDELERKVRKLEILLLLAEKKILKRADELDEETKRTILKAFSILSRDLIAIEEKIEKRLKKADLEKVRDMLLRDFKKLEEIAAKHSRRLDRISKELEKLAEAYHGIFQRRLESSYIISDRDVIRTLLRVRESARKGKWKGLPAWAKEMRKEVLQDLGERIIMATEVAVAKELVNGPRTAADLLKKVPVSRYTLRKALARMEKARHVRRRRDGRRIVYEISF